MVLTRNQNRENNAKSVEWEKAEKERQQRIRMDIVKVKVEERKKRLEEKKQHETKIVSWEEHKRQIHLIRMQIMNGN